jgi:hypothetical protein
MARARTIKPGLFTNEFVADCSFAARYLFTGLWTIADREGRMKDQPRTIKAMLLPMDDVDCDELLEELHEAGLIVRYEAGEHKVLQVINFVKHQRPHPSEAKSDLPCFDKTKQHIVVRKNERSCENTSNCAFNPSPLSLLPSTFSPSTFELPTEVCTETAGPSVSVLPVVVLEFPTEGKGGKSWGLTEAKLAEYLTVYPNLDVMGEMRKALQWCRDNPTKLKTKGGMPAFLTRWLNRAQDRPSGARDGPQSQSARPMIDPGIFGGGNDET